MQSPIQLTFRSMAHSDALATHLQQRVDQLEHVFNGIISCHVVIELDGHHHRHGDHYRFSINVGLPGHELLVNHVRHGNRDLENPYAAADLAFDEAARQLEDWVKRSHEHRQAAGVLQA